VSSQGSFGGSVPDPFEFAADRLEGKPVGGGDTYSVHWPTRYPSRFMPGRI